MPAISFSVFKDKLLSGEKCQTIRKPRKRPLKEGDVLHVFWKMRTKQCEKLGTTKIVKIEPRLLGELTLGQIQKDGFKDFSELIKWFRIRYGDNVSYEIFDVITFEALSGKENTPP